MVRQIAYRLSEECVVLRLYTRLRQKRDAGYSEDLKSGELEEGWRGGKRCGCPIHASGNIRGKFKRQSTGEWEWDAAKSAVARWESAGAWDEWALNVASEPCPAVIAQSSAPTIREATEAFLSKCETRGILFAHKVLHYDLRGLDLLSLREALNKSARRIEVG
jgi:hypothetical protein